METKIFYRVGNVETQQGLWYDFKGNFTGLIHDKYDFCTNYELPMPFDPDVIGWLSATDNLNELFFWFTKEDIEQLEEFGYGIGVYEATEYRFYDNHWVIKQDSSIFKTYIPVDSLMIKEQVK
jgi:hypothetical protein